MRSSLSEGLRRRVQRDAVRANEGRDACFRRMIRSIPRGKVSTYGRVAEAAGYPIYHRAVARLLRSEALTLLPWQRVVGSAGEIRLKGEFALEQRLRLKMEGVSFSGKCVDMDRCEHKLRMWEMPE